MKPIPTAKEFLESKVFNKTKEENQIIMIEFTKFHVEAALKKASEKAEMAHYNQGNNLTKEYGDSAKINGVMSSWEGKPTTIYIDKDSILNAYPLTNIK